LKINAGAESIFADSYINTHCAMLPLGPRFPFMNAPLGGRTFFTRIKWPPAMLRTAFDCGINGALEPLPSVGENLPQLRLKRFAFNMLLRFRWLHNHNFSTVERGNLLSPQH
jgi:hypothetical protein